MNIQINNERRNPKLDNHIQSRLTSAIGRYSQRIDHVDIYIRDESPGNDGSEKVCIVDIKMIPRGRVHVSGKDKNIYAAATEAARHAQVSFQKAISRQRTRRHSRTVPSPDELPNNHEGSVT